MLADASGSARLASQGDFVRLEVQSALDHESRVVPVLVGGATMPAEEDLPAPLDDSVTLHAVPKRRLAAISFGGWATDGRVESKTEELLATLSAQGIDTLGPPSLNQYNPPWTPPWMYSLREGLSVCFQKAESGKWERKKPKQASPGSATGPARQFCQWVSMIQQDSSTRL